MFKKTPKTKQLSAFTDVASALDKRGASIFEDPSHWHNQFRQQVLINIDETLFKPLFSEKKGAPNASVRLLVGLMILKEAFGYSDEILFEHAQFNVLVRSALGLFDFSESIPAASTYYLFRKHIYQYDKTSNEPALIEQVFNQLTALQIKTFKVNTETIRMDSKLFGSNIAFYSRYELIVQSVIKAWNVEQNRVHLDQASRIFLEQLCTQDPEKTVYRTTKAELNRRLTELGQPIAAFLQAAKDTALEQTLVLKRVFDEQYEYRSSGWALRANEQIRSDSVQSPHDIDCAFRKKNTQSVRGYSANVTETCVKTNQVNLITSLLVEPACTSDVDFVGPSIDQTRQLTDTPIKQVITDGAFQSPANDEKTKGIEMIHTGLQGNKPAFRVEFNEETQSLQAIDSNGVSYQAKPTKLTKRSKEPRWRIDVEGKAIYFCKKAVRAAQKRAELANRTKEELDQRNNVEATIYHLSHRLRNKKSKYRGLNKQKVWLICTGLWINFTRIMRFNQALQSI